MKWNFLFFNFELVTSQILKRLLIPLLTSSNDFKGLQARKINIKPSTFYDNELYFLYSVYKSQNLLKLKFYIYYLTYIDKKCYRNNCFEYFGTGTLYLSLWSTPIPAEFRNNIFVIFIETKKTILSYAW